jgi:Sulfotransferase family
MAPPVFIVGNDRSGTTMLRLILDRGPDIAIPPESMFLTDLADRRADGGPRTPEAVRALVDEVWGHPKVRLWQLPGDPPEPPPGLTGADAYRFAVEAPFRAYAARHGKSRWGDKTPHYVHHVDALLEVWPDARFVVLVRDGRDVALSLKRMPFGPNNAWAAGPWWARGIRAGAEAARRHPDQVRTVRYEDLVADPDREVRAICAFLELAYEPQMLDLAQADRSRVVADQSGWFPTLFEGVNTRSAGRWQTQMPERDQRLFALHARAELEALGYPVPGGTIVVSERRAGWYRRQNQLMRNVNFVRLRVFQERGRELRFALARRLSDPLRRQRAAR